MSVFTTLSDQELGLVELQLEARLAYLGEIDALAGDPETGEPYPEVANVYDELDEVHREQNERARLGIVMQHDHERIEVALAPFGPEWEREREEQFEETGSYGF